MIIILKNGYALAVSVADPRPWDELALAALSSGGRRAGGARRAVVGLLAEQRCCLSAQEVADRLRADGRRVGVASVYRALDLLSEEGLVARVEVGDGGARYEPVIPGGSHHHHAVCNRCGRLTAFEDAELERAIDRLADRIGHRVQAHDVLIRGQCPRCSRS
jgi:Fur family ferric uptake transcriptional regulator